jgi:hypothetical protein
MRYTIRANPRIEAMARFWKILNDGTVGNQKPDGHEIVASMKRAVIAGGRAEWSETCYCTPPLQHERSTIYDQFFTDIEIEPVDTEDGLKGERFWDYLKDQSMKEAGSGVAAKATIGMRYAPIRIL